MELLGTFGAFFIAAVCFVVGFFSIGAGRRTAEVPHHHTFGSGLGCGWVFLAVGAIVAALGLYGLAGG